VGRESVWKDRAEREYVPEDRECGRVSERVSVSVRACVSDCECVGVLHYGGGRVAP
jgi:hypothetical protein